MSYKVGSDTDIILARALGWHLTSVYKEGSGQYFGAKGKEYCLYDAADELRGATGYETEIDLPDDSEELWTAINEKYQIVPEFSDNLVVLIEELKVRRISLTIRVHHYQDGFGEDKDSIEVDAYNFYKPRYFARGYGEDMSLAACMAAIEWFLAEQDREDVQYEPVLSGFLKSFFVTLVFGYVFILLPTAAIMYGVMFVVECLLIATFTAFAGVTLANLVCLILEIIKNR